MKIEFKLSGIEKKVWFQGLAEQSIEKLRKSVLIESAQVTLAKRRDVVPACHASVWLAVPGPDIHAAAHDHTMLAAWTKIMAELKRQIKGRVTRRLARLRSNLKLHAVQGQRA